MKIDLAYDLLSGTVISHSLHGATTQDKTIGKDLVVEVRPGDLVLRDGWHPMLTNLERDQADVSQLVAIYRARRTMEIQFRAWKQSPNLTKALDSKSNEHHMQALVFAGMIAHQLGMSIAKRLLPVKTRTTGSIPQSPDGSPNTVFIATDSVWISQFFR